MSPDWHLCAGRFALPRGLPIESVRELPVASLGSGTSLMGVHAGSTRSQTYSPNFRRLAGSIGRAVVLRMSAFRPLVWTKFKSPLAGTAQLHCSAIYIGRLRCT